MSIDKPVPRNSNGPAPLPWDPSGAGQPPNPYHNQYRNAHTPYGPTDEFLDSGKTLKDYIDVVLRRRVAVMICLLVSVIITVGYLYWAIPLYTSNARIEVLDKQSKSEKRVTGDDTAGDSRTSVMSTEMEILVSKSLAEAVVDETKLMDAHSDPVKFSLAQIPSYLWRSIFDASGVDSQSDTQNEENSEKKTSLMNWLSSSIGAKPVRSSNLIDVWLTTTAPKQSNEFLKAYLDVYLRRNLEKRRRENVQVVDWLKDEGAKVQKRVRESEAKLLDFSIENGLLVSTEGSLGQVMGILNRKVESQQRSEEAKLRAQVLKESKFAGTSVTQSQPDQTYLNKLKEDMSKAEAEYTSMQGVYSPTYPKMVLAARKINFLKDRIIETEKNMVSGALEFSEKEEQAFKATADVSRQEVTRVKGLEAEYSILKKDVETNSEFLKLIMKETQQMEIKASTTINNLALVDPPSLPKAPSWPKKNVVILIGILAGLAGGVMCAFVWEHLDDTLQNPDHLTKSLQIRRLGIVPDVSKTGTYSDNELTAGSVEFLAYYKPKTPLADAVRNLQMSVLFSNPGYEIKCLSVSSSLPSEGKTLLAVSFASVLCTGDDRRVIIVDLDLRKPRIHNVFGVPGTTPGLSNILNGNGDQKKLSEVIHSHTIPGLYYVTAGPVPPDSVSLLHSMKFKDLVSELRETFDYIIFDCPPILGFPDTPIVSRYTDGLILVARQGYVGKNEIAEAIDQVSSVDGANVLGVVFNRAYAPALYSRGYKYGYRYGGHYYNQSYKYYHKT